MSTRRAWQRFEVNLTGAFLTGEPLQVRVSEYSRFQHDLGEELKHHPSGGWDYEGGWRDTPSYDTGGGYTSLVPLVLVRREGHRLIAALEDAHRRRPEAERRGFAELMEGWMWELRAICIDLYDFGVGVINGVYDVAAPAGLNAAKTRQTIESLSWLKHDAVGGVRSPVAAAYNAIARETVEVFSSVVGTCADQARQEPWLAPFLDALPSGDRDGDPDRAAGPAPHEEWGRLLWLHPIYVLTGSSRAGPRRLSRIARPFEVAYSQSLAYRDGLFAPGIDSSVVVVRGGADDQFVPLKLIGMMWAYYALFMEIDRGLLATLDNDKWSQSESLRGLERDADRIFALHMRVQEARARLDSALAADLGGGELSVWNVLAEVTKFGDLVAAVEGKVDALQRIAERRAEQAAANRARRTSNVLSGLTALTIVTVTIAVMTNFIGTRADAIGHGWLRIVIVMAAFVLALVLYREAQREIGRTWRGVGRRRRAGVSRDDLEARPPASAGRLPRPLGGRRGTLARPPYGSGPLRAGESVSARS